MTILRDGVVGFVERVLKAYQPALAMSMQISRFLLLLADSREPSFQRKEGRKDGNPRCICAANSCPERSRAIVGMGTVEDENILLYADPLLKVLKRDARRSRCIQTLQLRLV